MNAIELLRKIIDTLDVGTPVQPGSAIHYQSRNYLYEGNNEEEPVAWMHRLYGEEPPTIDTLPPEQFDRYWDHVPLYAHSATQNKEEDAAHLVKQDKEEGEWVYKRFDRDSVMNSVTTIKEE